MRLGALLLTGAALAAQVRPSLPWEQTAPLAWQPMAGADPGAGPAPLAPSTGPLKVSLSGDGTLRVIDERGLVRLQAGLPGRPLRVWRDGGVPLDPAQGSWPFPSQTPLVQGLGALQWCAEDFRPFLSGLLWILEDGEAFLSVVHPATGRIIHLPAPPGRDLILRFLPDRLEVNAGSVETGAPHRWSLPWIGLLPRLASLGPRPEAPKVGTALAPFPRE